MPGPQGLRVLEGPLVALAQEVRPVQPVLQGHRGLVERSEKLALEVLQVKLVQPVQRAHKALQGQLVMLVQPEKLAQRVQRAPQAQILQFRVHRAKLAPQAQMLYGTLLELIAVAQHMALETLQHSRVKRGIGSMEMAEM